MAKLTLQQRYGVNLIAKGCVKVDSPTGKADCYRDITQGYYYFVGSNNLGETAVNIVIMQLTKRHKQHVVNQQTAKTFCNRNIPDSKKWTVGTYQHLQVNDCIKCLVTCMPCLNKVLAYYKGL